MIKEVLYRFLILSGIVTYGQVENTNFSVKLPENYLAKIDVVYTRVNNWDGRMDLYTNPDAEKPTPLVINIHGGGWNHGAKETQTGFGSFFNNGYAVANVEYRLVDVAPAPAAIQDVRCALIYIYRHAEELNIDTNKIVVMGGSSGGHLALMAGLLGNDRKFDTNCEYDGTIKIAAIIDKYGVTDLVPLSNWSSAKRWLGKGFGDKKFTESVSPIYYVDQNSAPVFIVHGDADPIVPYSQSVELSKKLKSFGIKTKFITIPNGGHGKFSNDQKRDISIQMWNFLKELGL
jgi:acetyl esterase/lipase